MHPGSAGGLQRGDMRLPVFLWADAARVVRPVFLRPGGQARKSAKSTLRGWTSRRDGGILLSKEGGFCMDQARVGRFIAACRRERGLTQRQLAEQLLVSDKTISKWETGGSLR